MEIKEITFASELAQTGWCSSSMTEKCGKIERLLEEELQNGNYLPPREKIFRALRWLEPDQVKVLILGQDPYHSPANAACGFSFSVEPGCKYLPPSLKNIFKELESDGFTRGTSGDLSKWVDQGVMLLNVFLTVRPRTPGSHKTEWKGFVELVIDKIPPGYVAILWGAHAQAHAPQIKKNGGKVIFSPHPSPYSASSGFFGSKPFSRCNKLLKEMKKEPVDWNLS